MRIHGRTRSVEVTAEVSGRPEQAWRAVATGPGNSCWFFPTEVDEKVGGKIVCHMGPGMDAKAMVLAWDPPYRLVANSTEDLGPDAPDLRTEWTVEPLDRGCRVRVKHSLEADSDQWDGSLKGMEEGWPGFLRVLQLYLKHFPDRNATPCCIFTPAPGSLDEVWTRLAESLPYEGTVEGKIETEDFREILIRCEEPVPALVALNAYPMGEQIIVGFSAFHYADPPPDEEALRAWVSA